MLVTAAVGLIVLLVGRWKVLNVGGATAPGIGLYLTVLGGVGVLMAGAWEYRSESQESTAVTAL